MILKEFNRNIELHGDRIKCRKGCSACCSQIFRITPADSWIIKDHIKKLSDPEKEILLKKALAYKIHDPCPALGESGECTIYEARPVICRKFGMPIYDYKKPGKIFACELNFADGEEIHDDKLIEEQTKIGIYWDKLKDEFEKHYPGKPLTIAETIISALSEK